MIFGEDYDALLKKKKRLDIWFLEQAYLFSFFFFLATITDKSLAALFLLFFFSFVEEFCNWDHFFAFSSCYQLSIYPSLVYISTTTLELELGTGLQIKLLTFLTPTYIPCTLSYLF